MKNWEKHVAAQQFPGATNEAQLSCEDGVTADRLPVGLFLLSSVWSLIFSDAQESLGNKIFRGLLLLFAHILASETWRAFSFYFRDWI